MKYINSHYNLFDTSNFLFNSNGFMCNGSGKISLPAENTKLYVLMEIDTRGANCYPLQIYMSDGEYSTVKPSTVQLYYNGNKSTIQLETNGNTRLTTSASQNWHKVYLVIDSTAGTIDYYVDGDKVGTYAEYVKTGVKAINAKLSLSTNSSDSYRPKIKNIIISDQYSPINETIIEVPATITNNGFVYDSSKNEYSTEAENSTLQAKPDLSVLNGYKVTACNVGMGTTVLGDTIKNIQCDMGTYSNTREIPATGKGMYFDGLPTSINNITITAKK